MLGFIAAPLVVMAILVYGIVLSMERGPSMVAEPVGAGAGDTGGANAIGRSLFGSGDAGRSIPAEQTARGAVLVVRDAGGVANAERPIVLLTNHGRWEAAGAEPLVLGADGLWSIALPPPGPGQTEPMAFRFAVLDGGETLVELDTAGEPMGERRLPRVNEDEAVGEEPLVYEFVVVGFGAGG
ncbi:hypothetical protein MNBD_PLANCTO03-2037 [hydrothermal vent metagenome]|uniref:Uncharacterized protein n=1 Tax=hydrothermal vent metagenome TaxID=652676 RepID=A0A3B1DEY6_9ZZZZ